VSRGDGEVPVRSAARDDNSREDVQNVPADSSVVVVGHGADRSYVEFCVSQGQRLGDIRPVSLHAGMG
jgi:hypothetical protein